MEKLPKQVYTAEFRQQAVELIRGEGLSIAASSRRLSISPKTLANLRQMEQGGSRARGQCEQAPPRGDRRGGRVVTPAPGER
jgi:transposase